MSNNGRDGGNAGHMSLPDLCGKRVLVTGSGGGLGKAMAVEFARHQCQVAVHYFTRAEGAADTRKQCLDVGAQEVIMHQADLRSEPALDELYVAVERKFGGVDVLVNNAGVVFRGAAEDCGAAHLDDVYAINVRAPYLLSRHAARGMRASGEGGVIINNTSIHASHGAVEYMSAYAMSKGALNALTQSLAFEWGPEVRVVAIAPGAVPVERNIQVLESEESKAKWLPRMATSRFGKPEDIARATAFLASSNSSWTSGSIITVDGGMTARINMPIRQRPPQPPAPSPVQHPGSVGTADAAAQEGTLQPAAGEAQ